MGERRQFAFRANGLGTFEIGLIRDDGQFVGIATANQQSWANDITVALNDYDFPAEKLKEKVRADG